MAASVGGGGPRRRLVVFDVEGVLLPARRYLLFEVARRLGFRDFVAVIALGLLYELGLLSLEPALRGIFRRFRGLTVDEFFRLYKGVPLVPDVGKVFARLREAGYRTALISSGLPTPFVGDLAAGLKADRAVGVEVGVEGGRLTGEVAGDVVEPGGKGLVLRRVLDEEGLSPGDCVVVADDRNNLPMFPHCGVRIGYNPDFAVAARSDFAVRGGLTEILPLILGDSPTAPRPVLSGSEALREAIHIGSFLVPFLCSHLLHRYLVSLAIFIVALLYGTSELLRLEGIEVPLFSAVTRRAAIKPELYGFVAGPIYFALGIALSLVLFPEPVGYASVAVLTLGDGFATVAGKRLGRTVIPFNKAKRLEGTVLGFLLASLGASAFVDPARALVGAAVGMLMECLPTPLSDNLAVPLASGLAMTIIP